MKDTLVHNLILKEQKRQKQVINLIPSENYCSKDVLTALGSIFDNKYAEGYPSARYYGGNEVVDKVEKLAEERALKLFNLSSNVWSVNVQPWSGSNANLAAYLALVPVGGKIMGMSLISGGHLSHGQKVSITGKVWQSVLYSVDSNTEVLDYEAVKEIACKEKPNVIVAGFTAYPRTVDFKKFREIADACGAYLLVDMSHIAGLIAGGAYPSPFPYADVVTTTTHKTLRGPRSAMIFSRIDERGLNKKVDKALFPGIQGGPHVSQIAAVAVALKEADSSKFRTYAKQVIKNAQALAKTLEDKGWRVVSGGTDSHLLLVDTWMGGVKDKNGVGGVPGKEAEALLEKNGIICNKNTIPNESRSPFDPSGIRIGSPAETTRGKKEKDFKKIGERIDAILRGVIKK